MNHDLEDEMDISPCCADEKRMEEDGTIVHLKFMGYMGLSMIPIVGANG
jgi:hypothetical protein